ncbi:hypothetical protein Clacol_003497 [Clathrus columnatus]|uniref:Uncharacterized protein n=1 Tax=Clathrus columnatus TaxID=1419009 RepID=A0AAV5A8I1_9AGAM|nr:hypothetical protein Clacol_003497 [Clathrus columnatus]
MKTLPTAVQLSRLAKSWTFDPFHPTFQMQTFLTSLSKHPKLSIEAVSAVQALKDNVPQKKLRYALTTHPFRFLRRLLSKGFGTGTDGYG